MNAASKWYAPILWLVSLAFGMMAVFAGAQGLVAFLAGGQAFLKPLVRDPDLPGAAEIVRFTEEYLKLGRRAPLAAACALIWGCLGAMLASRSAWQFLLAFLAGLLCLLTGASIAVVEWPVVDFDPRAFVGAQLKALEELALVSAAVLWLAWLHLRSGRLLSGAIRFFLACYAFYVISSLGRLIPPELLARPLPPLSPEGTWAAPGLLFFFWLTAFFACWSARPSRWQNWASARPPERLDADALRRAGVGLGWVNASFLVLFLVPAAIAAFTILRQFQVPHTLLLALIGFAFFSTQWGALAGLAGRLCCLGAPAGKIGRLLLFLSLILLMVLLLMPVAAVVAELLTVADWHREAVRWYAERLKRQEFPWATLDLTSALIVLSSFGFLIFTVGLARSIKDSRSVQRLLWLSGMLVALPILVLPIWFMGPERYLLCVAIAILGESPMVAIVLAGFRRSLAKHIRLVAPETAEEYLQRGTQRYVAGDYAGANADFSETIRLEPTNQTAHLNRGAARLTQNDHAGAVADFTAVLEHDPRAGDAYLNRAIAHQKLGEVGKAIDDLTRAAEVFPDNTHYVLERGHIHLDRQDYAAAVADFTRVLEMDPGQTEAYKARAKAYEGLGQPDHAAADLAQLDAQVQSANPFA